MPFVQDDPVIEPDFRRAKRTINSSADLTFRRGIDEYIGAAIREGNLSYQFGSWLARKRDYAYDPEYSPFEDDTIRGFVRMFPEEFTGVHSREEASDVIARIQRTQEDSRILYEAGAWGFVATLAAGLASPENLIPLSWIGRGVKAARAVVSVKRGVAAVDDAVRLGTNLTRAEQTAWKAGRIAPEAVDAAKAAEAQVLADLRVVGVVPKTEGELALVAELAELRAKGATTQDLREFYDRAIDRAVLEGRPPPFIRTADPSGQALIDAELELLQARAATESGEAVRAAQVRGSDAVTRAFREAYEAVEKRPSLAELRRYYREVQENAAQQGRPIPSLRNPLAVPEGHIMFGKGGVRAKTIDAANPTERQLRQFFKARVDGLPVSGIGGSPSIPRVVRTLRAAHVRALEEAEKGVTRVRATLAANEAKAALARDRAALEAARGAVEEPTRAQLQEFFERATDEAVTAGRELPMVPRELEIRRRLGVLRQSRLEEQALEEARAATPVSEVFSPAVRTSTGRTMPLTTAERFARHQRSFERKILEAKDAVRAQSAELSGQAVPRKVAEGVLLGTSFATGSEALSQAFVDGRDDEIMETAVIAGAGLGALLGSFGGLAARYSQKRLLSAQLSLLDDLLAGPTITNLPAHVRLTPAEARKLGAKAPAELARRLESHSPGLGKLIGEDSPLLKRLVQVELHHSPVGRLNKSQSVSARAAAKDLVGAPFLRDESDTPVVAVDSRVIDHSVRAVEIQAEVRKLGRGREFHANIAQRRWSGLESADPKVNQAAEILSEYFDSGLKIMQDLGIIDATVNLGKDHSYLPRVWNYDAIDANPQGFVDAIAPHVGGKKNAADILNEIQGHGPHGMNTSPLNRLPGKLERARTSPMLDRQLLNVPSTAVSDFVIKDIDYLLDHYARLTGTQIEYVRLFRERTGHVGPMSDDDLQNAFTLRYREQEILNDYAELRSKTKDPKKLRELADLQRRDLEDLRFIVGSHLGFIERDPFNRSSRRISSTLVAGASVTMLPNAGIASLIDLPAAAHVVGARHWFRTAWNRTLQPLANLRTKYSKDRLAAAWRDMEWAGHQHSRAGMFYEGLIDEIRPPEELRTARGLTFNRVVRGGQNLFFKATGLTGITAFNKEFTAIGVIDRLLDVSARLAKGETLDASARNFLRLSGIDDATAKRIGREVLEGGAEIEQGTWRPMFSKWKDQDLAHTARGAVAQSVRRGVLNPSPAELPMLAHSDLGRLLVQFLSFPRGASHAYLLSSIQRRDAAAVQGIMAMIGLGIFIEGGNHILRGEDPPEWKDLVFRGFLRSGVIGIWERYNDVIGRGSGGTLDLARLFGARSNLERYGPLETTADLIPAGEFIDRSLRQINTSVRMINGEPVSDAEMRMFWRRWPLMQSNLAAPILEPMIGGRR